jgi:protein TonB
LRQAESGRSTPIFLIHDVDHGEDARRSLDDCDCDQIVDRPVRDDQLLDLCKRMLPVKTSSVEEATAADPDSFLSTEQLGDALDRLNLIIDDEADKSVPETAASNAEQRGDFSHIAGIAETVASPPAADPPETTASTDLDDEISAHVDTLFGGGATSEPASDVEEATPVAGPPEAAAKREVQAPRKPSVEWKPVPAPAAPRPAPQKPRVKVKPVPAPAAPRPAPPRVVQSQTEAVVRRPVSKTAPAAPKFAAPHEEPAGRRKLWLIAASAVIVILGGAFVLFLMRGSSADPVAAIPDAPVSDNSGNETIASAGLPIQEDAPSSLPVPVPAQQQADVIVPAKPDPPKPTPRKSTPPKTTTRQQPKRETRPAPKRTTEAAPKAEPKPAPVKVAAAQTTSPPTPTPERVEPATETAQLTPRSEPTPQPAVTTPPPQPTAAVATADLEFIPPIVVERVEPVYPRKALKKAEKGAIVINVLVGVTGSIARVVVDNGTPGSELEAAAINAVMRWKFEPATEGGTPVKAWTTARFVFD